MQVIKLFLIKILLKGGEDMMAMLFANQIILGRATFAQVPKLLKDPVKALLDDCGMGFLAEEDNQK